MFSRAAKSVVKSLGSRRIHIGGKNFKIALIGAGEISQTLSQLLKNSAKLNVFALYDVAAVNRPLPNYNFYDEQPFKSISSKTLTMAKKSCSSEGSRSNAAISTRQTNNNNHQENNGRSQIEKLVEALYRLPIAEEAPAFNSPLIPIEEIMPKLQSKEENLAARPRESGIGEAVKKFEEMEAFLKSLLRASMGTLEECSISITGYNLRPIFGTGRLGLDRWNCQLYLINMLNSRLICTRDFSFFKNKPRNILLKHKAFGWTHEQSRKQFLKRSFMTKCKLPLSNKPAPAMSVCYSTASSPKSQRNKTYKTSVYRGPCYPISLHRFHWRGFHSSLFPLAKSDSNKPSTCKKMDKICKPTEVKKTDESGRPCKEKSDVCRQEKVKCDKQQMQNKEKVRQKPKMEQKGVDPACRKTCLPIGKCELPRTVPPPKMKYAKVTCPPPKFAKPKPCPPVLEHFHKDDKSHIEIKQINARKKQICTPLPLPKPPYAPIVLCPCPPPCKVHPGPCPCYETKKIAKQPSIQPCKLKKEYPCPTGVHYCPPHKKPCNLKRETGRKCDRRKEKETPIS